MLRTHYKSFFTVLSVFAGILFSAALTLMAGYLAGISPDQERAKASVLPAQEPVLAVSEKAPAAQTGSLPAPQPAAKLTRPFFVRAQGARGPLVVYEMASRQEQFRLPAGMPSADWKSYFAAIPQQDGTLLQVFKPQTGVLERSFTLAGHWGLSGVSPAGHWVALTRLPGEREKEQWLKEARWLTDVQIIDTATGQVGHTVQFEGNFEVETISTWGDSLFLIEHLPAVNPTHYLVRLYDLAAAQLQPGALRAKTATEQVMTGLAWGGLASPDGQWLLTLYLNTQRDVAFIHTLNLENKFPFCIDLPSGQGELDQLKAYSLALSPDGQKVYAANAALGVVAEVSLESLQVIRQVEFPAGTTPKIGTSSETDPTNYSVVSKDGRRLYFTSGWDVWSYDTHSGEVRGPYWRGASLKGLALSEDEQQLYLAVEGELPLVVELGEQVALNSSSK